VSGALSPRGPYVIKTCRAYASGKWCPRRLRNSDWKTQRGTQDAVERVPDTVLHAGPRLRNIGVRQAEESIEKAERAQPVGPGR
jgi:hypothetical protein